MALAKQLADRAAAMNPTIPQIHFVAGQVALFNGQHDKAIEVTKRAIAYSPNYADAYALLAWILNYTGRPHDALLAMDTAVRLNPIIPSSYSYILGEIRFQQGAYAKAKDAFGRALDINPSYVRARMWLIVTLVQTGNQDEVEWQVNELMLWSPSFSLARLEYAFPFKQRWVRERVLQRLRQAGLPN